MANQEDVFIPSPHPEYIGWDFFEHKKYERGTLWYVCAAIISLGLLIYAVISANFLFAFIIILFALVTYLASLGEPAKSRFAVTEGGIRIGTRNYPFREIRRFWFIYEPPTVKTLYLETKSMTEPRITVDLEHNNPNDIRGILARFVREDISEAEEPFTDYIGRILKI